MSTTDNYRYPGSRPFQDTDHDRCLFFGRDQEKESLLHLVLAEHLVVLFAKSGMGKTSLLNAGLLQPLRERDFIPLKVRFNDPKTDPIQVVYAGIEETVKQHKVEYKSGDKDTLWQYFKTVEFWSANDILLIPVLILDQFEDFFAFHSPEERQNFITQLADLVKGRIPQELRESLQSEEESPYSEASPGVKTIISIREDFLGQLEEMSREISDILQNRFRLLPLNREQAKQAIIEPARLQDEQIKTKSFHYAPEAVETMLDFLCKRRKRRDIIITELKDEPFIKKCLSYVSKLIGILFWLLPLDYFYKRLKKFDMIDADEVEPFQLQLLCQHIENTVSKILEKEGADVTVQKDDLSGETGMQQVLQDFYDNQIKRSGSFWKKRKVYKLCEKGLISGTDRRLSVEEEEIERRFNVPKSLLAELVNNRLLRAEPRVGSVYYELSHDTLVEPIRRSQNKRKIRRIKAGGMLIVGVLFLFALYVYIWHRGDVYIVMGKAMEYRLGRQEEAAAFYRQAIKFDPKDAYPYMMLGANLHYQGKYNEAMEQFYKVIQFAPEYPNAYSWLGNTLYAQGRYEEAIEQYQKAIQLDPDYAWYYSYLASVFRKQEKYDEAIEQYRKAIELDPKNSYAYYWLHWLGFALSNQGKYDEAIESYQKAIELDPKSTFAYEGLENALTKQGKYDEIIDLYNKAIQRTPEDDFFYNRLGLVFSAQEKYDEAIEYYHKAIELDPNEAVYHSNLGNTLIKQDKYNEAIEQHHKAIELDPDYAWYYVNLGDNLRDQKKYEEAIEQYHKAIKLNPDDVTAIYVILGNTLTDQRKYDEAMEQYHKAIELEPNKAYPYVALGISLCEQGRYEEAIAQYRKAIELEPENSNAHYWLGNTLYAQERYEETIEQYQKAIQLDPDYAWYYSDLAGVFRKQEKYDEAIEQYRKAIELEPESQWIYNELGDALSDQDKFDEAIEHYQKALALDPKKFRAKYNLAKTHLITGRFDAALALAGEVLNEQNVSIQPILGMRFLSISSLFLQGRRTEAFDELKAFIVYYKSLPENYEKDWKYERSKNFISTTDKLSESDKTLLLTLIDILESPKPEADRKLEELEASLAEMFKE